MTNNIGTNRINNYLNDISKFKLLKNQDEIDLAKRIKQGDQKAKEKLVSSNLRFVISVAKDYQGLGISLEDLINEGNVGLIKAAERFDETRGFKFITYAVWWIKQSIFQCIADKSKVVRFPVNRMNNYVKLTRFIDNFEQNHGHKPAFDDIERELELSKKDVIQAYSMVANETSLDDTLRDSETEVKNFMALDDKTLRPDHDLDFESLREDVWNVLKSLNERESNIIQLYFGVNQERPYTLEEIAGMYHLTRERVRQIKEKALSRLKHSSRSKLLVPYVH
jgi:RNA polymerase primary sigma factor